MSIVSTQPPAKRDAMKHHLPLAVCCLLLSATSFAQFTGPSATGRVSTVEQARNAPIDTYVTVTGNIVAHLREEYYTFRDATGEIRVEIERPVWRNRDIGPDTKVRLLAEVDRNAAGTIYLWVESLAIIE
jgi:uncharacterized protein (TIGR00156 family)